MGTAGYRPYLVNLLGLVAFLVSLAGLFIAYGAAQNGIDNSVLMSRLSATLGALFVTALVLINARDIWRGPREDEAGNVALADFSAKVWQRCWTLLAVAGISALATLFFAGAL